MHLVFLLEELSAKIFLDQFLPRWLPDDVGFTTVPHEGKNDLEKSIPRKLRAWKTPDTYFVILRDKDSGDCTIIRQKLVAMCTDNHRPDSLVRIAIHELESWFLGNLNAVGEAFNTNKLGKLQAKAKFRDPDHIASPAEEIKKLISSYQKTLGAKKIGAVFPHDANYSTSFNVFLTGIQRLIEDNRA